MVGGKFEWLRCNPLLCENRVSPLSLFPRVIRIMCLFHLIGPGMPALVSPTSLICGSELQRLPTLFTSSVSFSFSRHIPPTPALCSRSSSQTIGPNLTQFQVFHLPVRGPSCSLPSTPPSFMMVFSPAALKEAATDCRPRLSITAGPSVTHNWDQQGGRTWQPFPGYPGGFFFDPLSLILSITSVKG